ncbi:MAG: protein kinase, partial [Planctomycetes bacterium]|nr:protein kinase [Planctomycetota bacterium]
MTPHDAQSRFTFGREIGRGGLGRVVEAREKELDRTVAVKLMREDLPAELAERFAREARLTARLEHPNIVPVHEFAMVDQQLMLSMKRVRGRDLGQLLKAVAEGQEPEWTRHLLLDVFQDICQGVAFAHAEGVIHRDLKPANVMIGDFGEVLIVDWGLAKETTAAEFHMNVERTIADFKFGDSQETVVYANHGGRLTEDGVIVGTPSYMPPEQADGNVAEMDERSDLYSLGAILYEILAFVPPVAGTNLLDILKQVKSGIRIPPSQLLRASHPEAPPLPPELDAICLKALSLRKQDRYPSAKALHADIQLYLEGVKERDRNRKLAEEAIRRARRHMENQEKLQRKAGAALRSLKLAERNLEPRGDKSAFWKAQDRVADLNREEARAFADAVGELIGALTHDRNHAEGRRLMAETHWRKFLEAEESGDAGGVEIHRRAVEQFNDGGFDRRLEGDGTILVRTSAYKCACMLKGRKTQPAEFPRFGYHAASGRALDGRRQGEGVPALEPAAPVKLRWHSPACKLGPLNGARVWAWRFEERDRRLVPVTPARSEMPTWSGPKESSRGRPVHRLFASDSPGRPEGPGIFLGVTPIERLALPMGSWLLIFEAEGFEPLRCPISIPRCGTCIQETTLFRPGEIPAGFLPVSAGAFEFQGDPHNPYSLPAEAATLPAYLVQRHPVTCAEYAEFLNAVGPAEAARRVPRGAIYGNPIWPGPPFEVPTVDWLREA